MSQEKVTTMGDVLKNLPTATSTEKLSALIVNAKGEMQKTDSATALMALRRASPTDMNSVIESGFYIINGTPQNTPAEFEGSSAGRSFLVVINMEALGVHQVLIGYFIPGMWIRAKWDDDWRAWKKVAFEAAP